MIADGAALLGELPGVARLREINDALERRRWGAAQRMQFYRRLATYVENGKQVAAAILELRDQTVEMAGPAWKRRFNVNVRALSEVALRVSGGSTLADALRGWAPDSERGLIRSGEASGALPQTLRSAAGTQAVVKRIVRKIGGMLFDPLVTFGSVIYLVDLIGSQMVPPMMSLAPPSKWPPMAKLLLPMAAVANSPWSAWVLLGFIGLIALAFATLSNFTGPIRVKLDSLPPWSIYKALKAAEWVMAFADFLAAGTPVARALQQQESWSTPWMRERLAAARIRVQGGMELGAAFAAAGHGFPEKTLIMDLKAFSGFADFPATIKRVAGEWFEEYEAKVVGLITVLGTVSNILVNVVMLITVFGMMSLQTVMQSAAH